MRRVLMGVVAVCFLCGIGAGPASGQNGIGFYGIGGRLSYVNPEDIDGTFGFGAHADLGEIFVNNLRLFPSLEYWKKSADENVVVNGTPVGAKASASQFAINSDARYYFPTSGNISIFAGGGLAIIINSSDFDFDVALPAGTVSGREDGTDSDVGLNFLGGIDLPIQENFDFTAEIRLLASDLSVFKISVGVTYMLSK